ncbi:MAG TPA: MopE-related protein, partial [Sandaracinaceae bacterium LLY-WYZ-13_1]|nr:MopE-related protein [Sandaracinaceae bacterium LLY-WYZ-13_1]
MERLVMRGVLLSSVLLLAACDGDASGEDAGATMDASAADAATDDAGMVCARSSECDDGLYCNGEERCEDAVCVDGESPCDAETERCVEDERTCATLECDGPEMGDYDGDGHAAMACGGDDCDDEDPNRYPGNEEVCDTEDHDEDCDPTTYGFRDADSDGEPDASCCNEDNCGTDCDDMRPGVNPTVPEVCGNDRDDDCDDMVDE